MNAKTALKKTREAIERNKKHEMTYTLEHIADHANRGMRKYKTNFSHQETIDQLKELGYQIEKIKNSSWTIVGW